jgi:dienelactone hydrolase
MRWLFWSSLALALVSCGGAQHGAGPFAYDAKAPLDVRNAGVYASSPNANIDDVSFAGVDGTRVPAYIVVPKSPGPHPAVLVLHGAGASRGDLLLEAALLGQAGIVALAPSQPNDATTYRPLVVDARRGLDLLAGRKDVDPKRIGVVGFSLGAQTAAILAGVDPRVFEAEVIAGRGTAPARYWLHRTHAHLFFQAGTEDAVVPHKQLLALIAAAPGKPKVTWYSDGHTVDPKMDRDMIEWQATELLVRR